MTRPRPHRIDRLFVALAAALALAGSPRAARADEGPEPLEPRRVAVFAVGVENYADPALQEENYRKNVRAIAEDAYAVFGALRAAARDRFAEGPSRYLIANRDPHPKWNLPNASELRKEITRADLGQALADFLDKLQGGDLAVIYLGGHGLAAPGTDSLYFLPSDYRGGKLPTAYAMETILKEINDSLAEKKDVRVLVLANMCHAGKIDAERLPEVLGKARSKAGPKIVYVPACAGDVRTFERQEAPFNGRSVFAHYLLRGLRGEAANKHGFITSKSLVAYLRARPELAGLPDIPDFEGRPALLSTISTAESEMRGMLADALIACAWDLDGDERRLLLALADRHLERRLHIDSASPSTQVQASLRRLQVRLLTRAGDKSPFELAAQVVRAAKAGPAGPYAEAVRKIQEVVDDAQPGKARVHALLACGYIDYQYTGISAESRAQGQKENEKYLTAHTDRWARMLQATPAAPTVTRQPLVQVTVASEGAGLSADPPALVDQRKQLIAALGQKVEELKKSAGPAPGELFFVYVGSPGLLLESEGPGKYRAPFWEALRRWPGKITVVWEAAGGASLGAGLPEDLRDRASVLAAVGNEKASSLAVYRLLDDFEDAVEKGLSRNWERDLTQVYKRRWVELIKRDPYLQAPGQEGPEPRWWGNTKELPRPVGLLGKLQAAARAAPLPTQDWAYDVAFGKVGRAFDSWPPYPPRQARTSAECLSRPWQDELRELRADLAKGGPAAPWRHLRAAALSEALRDFDRAALDYGEFGQELTKLLTAAPHAHPAESPQKLLEGLRDVVKGRKEEAERAQKSPPGLHLVLVPAGDYSSPLIPALRGPRADVAAWRRAFESLFQGPNKSRLTVTESKPGAARQDVLDDVDKAIAGGEKDDVIVFVFSGRGYQEAGRRYLVPAGIRPPQALPGPNGVARPMPRATLGRALLTSRPALEQMLDVGELTRRCADAGRSFVGIFDCQFTPPPAGTSPWPLDKHLLASFPLPREEATAAALAARARGAAQPAARAPRPGEARHVVVVGARGPGPRPPLLIWWAGQLQEDLDAADPARGQAASPFSRALLQALTERQGTGPYEDWACRAGKALTGGPAVGNRSDGFARPAGRFVVQGPVERPVLLPSVSNDTLRLLLRDYYRRRHNLDLALQLLGAPHDAVLREPVDQLTQAALLVQRARYLAEVQPDDGPREAQADWKAAADLLDRVNVPALLGGTGTEDTALSDAFAYYLTEALKHAPAANAPAHGNALWGLRERAKAHPELRTEFVARLLVDLTRSSIQRTSNVSVRESLNVLKLFSRRPSGWEDDLQKLVLPESAPSDLHPIEYAKRP